MTSKGCSVRGVLRQDTDIWGQIHLHVRGAPCHVGRIAPSDATHLMPIAPLEPPVSPDLATCPLGAHCFQWRTTKLD